MSVQIDRNENDATTLFAGIVQMQLPAALDDGVLVALPRWCVAMPAYFSMSGRSFCSRLRTSSLKTAYPQVTSRKATTVVSDSASASWRSMSERLSSSRSMPLL